MSYCRKSIAHGQIEDEKVILGHRYVPQRGDEWSCGYHARLDRTWMHDWRGSFIYGFIYTPSYNHRVTE